MQYLSAYFLQRIQSKLDSNVNDNHMSKVTTNISRAKWPSNTSYERFRKMCMNKY